MKKYIIKLKGDTLFNLRFIFNPGSCGYFCLRYIVKKRVNKDVYISLWKVKGILFENGYYCICLRVKNIEEIVNGCLTLLNNKGGSKHYVVIKKIENGKVYFYDPLFIGVRCKKIDKFIKRWSKICLFYTKV